MKTQKERQPIINEILPSRRSTRSSKKEPEVSSTPDTMQTEESPSTKATKNAVNGVSRSASRSTSLRRNGSEKIEIDLEEDPDFDPELDESSDEREDSNPLDSPFKRLPLQEVCQNLLDVKSLLQHQSDLKQKATSYKHIFARSEGVLDEVLVCLGMLNLKAETEEAVRQALLQAISLMTQAKKDYEVSFYAVRKLCLDLSNILKKVPAHPSIDCIGISDILYFYSVTFTYFTNHPYPSVSSKEKASVKKCDVPDFTRYFTENSLTPEQEAEVLKTDTKIYSSSYIWAQMTIWWKQTVEKPEATLSQERRGTLSYPTFLQSFVHQDEDASKEYDYPYTSRENWHRKLIDSRAASWPIFKNRIRNLHTWSFRNDSKMYGTFLLEEVVFEGEHKGFVETAVKALNRSEAERNRVFYKLNIAYFKRANYKFPLNIKELTEENQQE